jgi:hypothetical protein
MTSGSRRLVAEMRNCARCGKPFETFYDATHCSIS